MTLTLWCYVETQTRSLFDKSKVLKRTTWEKGVEFNSEDATVKTTGGEGESPLVPPGRSLSLKDFFTTGEVHVSGTNIPANPPKLKYYQEEAENICKDKIKNDSSVQESEEGMPRSSMNENFGG